MDEGKHADPQDHYASVKGELLKLINKWEDTEWEIGVKWAKSTFQHKLKEYTIDKAKIQIEQKLGKSTCGGTVRLPVQTPYNNCPSSPSFKQNPVREGTNGAVYSPLAQKQLKSTLTPQPLCNNSNNIKVVNMLIDKTSLDRLNQPQEKNTSPTIHKTMVTSNVSVLTEPNISCSQGEPTQEEVRQENYRLDTEGPETCPVH